LTQSRRGPQSRRGLRCNSKKRFFREFRETRQARNAADTASGTNRCHGLQRRARECRMRANKPLLHGDITASTVRWSSRPKPGNRSTRMHRGNSLLVSRRRTSRSASSFILAKRRFYRVFFENRFKQRNQPCPSLPLPFRVSRPFNCRFPRTVPL